MKIIIHKYALISEPSLSQTKFDISSYFELSEFVLLDLNAFCFNAEGAVTNIMSDHLDAKHLKSIEHI